MKSRPSKLRVVEDYWLYTQVTNPERPRTNVKKYADRAITALESSQQRMVAAAHGQGLVEETLPFSEIEILVCGKQARIEFLEKLLEAAYELYADDGYLVSKEEWLETLQIEIGEIP